MIHKVDWLLRFNIKRIICQEETAQFGNVLPDSDWLNRRVFNFLDLLGSYTLDFSAEL